MTDLHKNTTHQSARKKFLALSLESTRKSYYPQLKKQLENTQKNEKRLQLLIDNMPAQISCVDSDERYVLVNRAFEKSFRLKKNQILGKRMKTIIGQKSYNIVISHIKKALSGKSGHFEFSFTTKKNTTRWYEINYVPEINHKSETIGFYALTIDLTEKKQADEEKNRLKDRLRQSQKMEAIGTLSGGIAHDFNNILSGIFGYSQLADTHINEPERAKEYINKVFTAAQRASSLIQQILTFSRQTKYNKQPIYLIMILKEALKLIRSTLPSNIEIREFLVSKSAVLADATQIHQVVMNLCTNAYHAMEDDSGILTVRLEDVLLNNKPVPGDTGCCSGDYLKLEISDTGSGIPPDISEKIFDPYFTTKKIDKGTGLGLAVVNGIVKKHNGFIEFDSSPGVGTVFKIYLPVIKDKRIQSGTTSKDEENVPDASERLMLVDDEDAILESLGTILSSRGYRVSSFDNSISALKEFKRDPYAFDIIVTDMTMPRMTGDRFSIEALKIRPNIPIILCTGFHKNFTEDQALKIGIKKYLPKPIISSELIKCIKKLLPEP